MMVIPVEYPTFIYFYNQTVVMNTDLLDSTLKKKINPTASIFFCEGIAKKSGGVEGLAQMITLSDLKTNSCISGENYIRKVRMLGYDI